MDFKSNELPVIEFEEVELLGGNNFLVSAISILKKQKWELERELEGLRERVRLLEFQNAAFMNVSADRLLGKTGSLRHL